MSKLDVAIVLSLLCVVASVFILIVFLHKRNKIAVKLEKQQIFYQATSVMLLNYSDLFRYIPNSDIDAFQDELGSLITSARFEIEAALLKGKPVSFGVAESLLDRAYNKVQHLNIKADGFNGLFFSEIRQMVLQASKLTDAKLSLWILGVSNKSNNQLHLGLIIIMRNFLLYIIGVTNITAANISVVGTVNEISFIFEVSGMSSKVNQYPFDVKAFNCISVIESSGLIKYIVKIPYI